MVGGVKVCLLQADDVVLGGEAVDEGGDAIASPEKSVARSIMRETANVKGGNRRAKGSGGSDSKSMVGVIALTPWQRGGATGCEEIVEGLGH